MRARTWLNVSVYDVLRVKVFDGEHRLRRPRHGLAERERPLVRQPLVQVASGKILHRKHHTDWSIDERAGKKEIEKREEPSRAEPSRMMCVNGEADGERGGGRVDQSISK